VLCAIYLPENPFPLISGSFLRPNYLFYCIFLNTY